MINCKFQKFSLQLSWLFMSLISSINSEPEQQNFNRTQSLAFQKPKPKKHKVDQFNTNAVDDLLDDYDDKPRANTMLPNQQVNGELEWDPFAAQYADDDIFDKADDINSSDDESNHVDLDKLFQEPKISLNSTQSNTRKNNSNIRSSDPFSIDNEHVEKPAMPGRDKRYSKFGDKNYDPYQIKNY